MSSNSNNSSNSSNSSNSQVANVDILKWAFKKGYQLARTDTKEGIHINFIEIEQYFLDELVEFYLQNKEISVAV